MSTDAAQTPTAPSAALKTKSTSLDADFHESTHTRNFRKAMSTRRLITNPNRHDDLLRSGSTHQLLGRRPNSSSTGPSPGALLPFPEATAPPGAAESLAETAETAEDLSEDESDFSGGSFCDAPEEAKADKEYLRKDLGASLHDDELGFDSNDEGVGGETDDDDDGLIADMKNRMKMDDAAASKES